MAARLNLVNASAGKRVGAWVIDKLPPAVLLGIGYGFGMAALLGAADAGTEEAMAAAAVGLFLWLGITSLLALAYGIWKWGWEARTGKTPGNVLLGLRTANEDGNAPGWAAIFIRGLIIAVGGLVPIAGAVVVVISNLWDAGGKVWVNDRNSTNGTAVTGLDGVRQQLVPGAPVAATSGATVEFGDRSFVIGQA